MSLGVPGSFFFLFIDVTLQMFAIHDLDRNIGAHLIGCLCRRHQWLMGGVSRKRIRVTEVRLNRLTTEPRMLYIL